MNSALHEENHEEFRAKLQSERDRLLPIFNRVANPDDWKAPISAWVDAAEVDNVVQAIGYFTATVAKVAWGLKPGKAYVTSVGYRVGPAGP